MFKVFANSLETTTLEEIGPRARRAEKMGYWGLQVPDALHDGLLLSTLALQATRHLVVATSVLLAFPRSPMTTAIAAWDLQRMSAGRFELGLGTQIKQNIEDRYSARWDSPVPQLREYIQALQAIFHSFQTGEKLSFEGAHYKLTRLQPFFNPGPIEHPDIPLLAGAVGPAMTRMAGKIADGALTHPTNTSPEYLDKVYLPRLQAGLDSSGRPLADFKLVVGPLCATGRNEQQVAAQWEVQRSRLGFLFSTPAYWPSLELLGWGETGPQLLAMSREGRWADMPQLITDELLEKMVPRGTYGEIAAVYRERYGQLTRRVTFPMPEDPADDEAVTEVISQLQGSSQD